MILFIIFMVYDDHIPKTFLIVFYNYNQLHFYVFIFNHHWNITHQEYLINHKMIFFINHLNFNHYHIILMIINFMNVIYHHQEIINKMNLMKFHNLFIRFFKMDQLKKISYTQISK